MIKLKFEIAKLDDRSMSMEFVINDVTVDYYEQIDERIFVWESPFNFPSTVDIRVSNKNPNDTRIDQQGNIIADKYIKLLDIVVDGLPCASYYVNKITFTPDSGDELITNYWGFNGTVRLNFNEENSFYWSIHTQNAVR
jgi:hypothetical protein